MELYELCESVACVQFKTGCVCVYNVMYCTARNSTQNNLGKKKHLLEIFSQKSINNDL